MNLHIALFNTQLFDVGSSKLLNSDILSPFCQPYLKFLHRFYEY